MSIHVVGGVYSEYCVHPRWNEVFGSGGRAAFAIANLGKPVTLHTFLSDEALEVFKTGTAWISHLDVQRISIPETVSFSYLHDLATPRVSGVPSSKHSPLVVEEEDVLRFGMLEGDAIVRAKRAVYDPQNGLSAEPFGSNGSTAQRLAIIVNASEARHLSGMPDGDLAKVAASLADTQGAEVVVVKMGALGALVCSKNLVSEISAFKTDNVWTIGSGDCFAAYFANFWMLEDRPPEEAAALASRATAYYCDTKGFLAGVNSNAKPYQEAQASTQYKQGRTPLVYLAGPFFDLPQVWMIEQARADLIGSGLKVFSPYHDVGLGAAEDVVDKDLDAIKAADLMCAFVDDLDSGTLFEIGYARALGKPVVIYSERHSEESLKMMSGSNCTVCSTYASAIYSTIWEAIQI